MKLFEVLESKKNIKLEEFSIVSGNLEQTKRAIDLNFLLRNWRRCHF